MNPAASEPGMPRDEAERRRVVRGVLRNDLQMGIAAEFSWLGLWSLSLLGRGAVAVQGAHEAPAPVAPIFLVGAPRTGTTFLHRLLVELGVGQGLTLGRMWLPARRLHRLLGPQLHRLDALGPGRFHDPHAHKTGMGAVETEDAALMFRFLDGFLAYAFFGAVGETELPIDPADPATVARDLEWLDLLWRGRALDQPGRVVAKAASFGLRVEALLARYPDARFVATLRDPCAVLPSALSLVQGALGRAFPRFAESPELRARHAARLSAALVDLLNRFALDWQRPGFPRDRVHLCAYPQLVGSLDAELDRLLPAVGVEPGAVHGAVRQAAVSAQRKRKSGHRYSLEQFGLEASAVRAQTAPFLDTFGHLLGGGAAA